MDDGTTLPSPRSKNLWNEAPNIHEGFNTCGSQTTVTEDARMANSTLMLTLQQERKHVEVTSLEAGWVDEAYGLI